MADREKLQIPTIEFTPVTLLNTSSSCDIPAEGECTYYSTSETQWKRGQDGGEVSD